MFSVYSTGCSYFWEAVEVYLDWRETFFFFVKYREENVISLGTDGRFISFFAFILKRLLFASSMLLDLS